MAKRCYEQIAWVALAAFAGCSEEAARRESMAPQAMSGASTVPQPQAPMGGKDSARAMTSSASRLDGRAGSPVVPAAGSGVLGNAATAGGASGQGAGGVSGQGANGATAVGGSHAAAQSGSGAAAQGGSGAAAEAGSGAARAAAAPSAGCAKRAPRPADGSVMTSDRIYTFPSAYDGMTPAPLLLALHAAGNPNTQLQKITQGSKLETDFIRAFPKSAGSAWVYNADVDKLQGILDELLAEYCIDEHRIFATGHSSGAQMVVQMLCKGEQRFRAVAPVAASKYCAELAPIPVLYIQGEMDAQRGGGNGEDVVRVFSAGNGCSETSAPLASVASCTSTFDRKEVAPGCVTYDDCDAETHWCSHNDNGYNNSDGRQHGWPCFANAAIADFFLGF